MLWWAAAVALYTSSSVAQAPPSTQPLPPSCLPNATNLTNSGPNAVSVAAIAAAVSTAKAYFAQGGCPLRPYYIYIPSGVFDLSGQAPASRLGVIDVSGVSPSGIAGPLIFQGNGRDRTTLVTSEADTTTAGLGVSHVWFAGMTLTRPRYTVTQGAVFDASVPGQVTLDISAGFPSPADLFNKSELTGRYLRAYTNSRTNPKLVLTATNGQVPWGTRNDAALLPIQPDAVHHPLRWTLFFDKPTLPAPPDYNGDALVCIKSKNGGQAYYFNDGMTGGTDIRFDDIRWLQHSRGVFRGRITHVQILNSVVERSPPINGQAPCLASAAGGPQIGQPGEPTSGNLVLNYRADATGDDSLAFFEDGGTAAAGNQSTISNVAIADSFARTILAYNSPGIALSNVKAADCDAVLLEMPAPHQSGGCPVLYVSGP